MSEHPSVHVHDERGVTRVTLDDGKANALSPEVVAALGAAVDRAVAGGHALALVGRSGRFSAGFDLSVMNRGPEAARSLVAAGAEVALRLYEAPVPVVMGCTGHALAMGAILLFAGDLRIGAAGAYKIGMNEVAIGMPLPGFATELARDRLSPRHLTAATCLARVYDPETAVDAGFLDRVVPADLVADTAVAAAEELGLLGRTGFAATKHNLRSAATERIRATLAEDVARFTVPTPEPGR